MGFDAWCDLIRVAGSDPASVNQQWLQQQFAQNASPALVSQLMKSGHAPFIPIIVQPRNQLICKSCGGNDFMWDQVAVNQHTGAGSIMSGMGCLTSILCFPVGLVMLLLGSSLAAGGNKTQLKQIARCRRCGWMNN